MGIRHTRRSVAALAASLVCIAAGSLVAAGDRRTPELPSDHAAIEHVLNRIAYGPRPGDVARVEAMGVAAYIEQQLHPERIDDRALEARLETFPTLKMSTSELSDKYFEPALALRRNPQVKEQVAKARAARDEAPSMQSGSDPDGSAPMMTPGAPAASGGAARPDAQVSPEVRQARAAAQTVIADLTQAKMLRAVMSDRQLEEVLTDFWFNHFNVSLTKGQVRQYLTGYERDAIRPFVFGRFRDMLGAVAHSPAMLFYLDNFQSAAPNTLGMPPALQQRLDDPRLTPAQRQRIRQRAQQMPQAKRPARGLNENYAREIMELHTLGVDGGYTQKDVTELARILTGWTIDRPQRGGRFIFRPEMHDQGTKTLLGVTFMADGEYEGERALDLLASHPATARHIAYELAQRFVADEPPAALVDRAAARFTATKGDLREVVRTIITSPEFFAEDARRAKVKTPLEFVVSSVRATGATMTNLQPLVTAMRNLGMPLYSCEPPTGYSMTADAWVNTGSLLNRMNFAVQLVSGGRITPNQAPGRGGQQPPAQRALGGRRGQLGRGPIAVDLPTLAPDTSEGARDRVVDALLGGDASAGTRETLARAKDSATLVALALGAPEFQRR
jgi:uncharacterized protein (DUF1800 family)